MTDRRRARRWGRRTQTTARGPTTAAGPTGGPTTAAGPTGGPTTAAGPTGGPTTAAGPTGGPTTAAGPTGGPTTAAGPTGGPTTRAGTRGGRLQTGWRRCRAEGASKRAEPMDPNAGSRPRDVHTSRRAWAAFATRGRPMAEIRRWCVHTSRRRCNRPRGVDVPVPRSTRWPPTRRPANPHPTQRGWAGSGHAGETGKREPYPAARTGASVTWRRARSPTPGTRSTTTKQPSSRSTSRTARSV